MGKVGGQSGEQADESGPPRDQLSYESMASERHSNGVEGTRRVAPADQVDQQILRTATLFQFVETEAVDDLVSKFETFYARSGSVIFREGDPGDYLYILLSGKLKVGRNDRNGRTVLTGLLGPPAQFGELSLIDSGQRIYTATVVSDARLARLGKGSLDRSLATYPNLTQQMLRILTRGAGHLEDEVYYVGASDIPCRLAKRLVELAHQFGIEEHSGTRVDHGLSRGELAELVGGSREAVGRALLNYADRGWIRVDHRSTTIVDPERLRRRAKLK